MKPLIRPFLFAVARLGLFLAVTAWIGGLHSEAVPVFTWANDSFFHSDTLIHELVIPYGFITSIFLFFNIALHIFYRKRPETQPCDD